MSPHLTTVPHPSRSGWRRCALVVAAATALAACTVADEVIDEPPPVTPTEAPDDGAPEDDTDDADGDAELDADAGPDDADVGADADTSSDDADDADDVADADDGDPDVDDEDPDEVVADSPFRACPEVTGPGAEPVVDGPLSDDEDVAAAQEARAAYALPSDEATVVALADTSVESDLGFPVTEDEATEIAGRSRVDIANHLATDYVPRFAPDSLGFAFVDQADGGTFVIGFTSSVALHDQRLTERWGDAVRVVEAPYSQVELELAAQDLLDDAPALVERLQIEGGIQRGVVALRVVDPSADDLEALADVLDPDMACLDGVRADDIDEDDVDDDDTLDADGDDTDSDEDEDNASDADDDIDADDAADADEEDDGSDVDADGELVGR